MSKLKPIVVAILGSLAAVLLFTGTASAGTGTSLTVGPVPLPDVPVRFCVTQTDLPGGLDTCVSTPPAQSVTLTVVATALTPVPTLTPPTITPIACPAGTQGAAAKVTTGSAAVAVNGAVTVAVNGTPVTVPVDQVVAPANQTVTLFACTGISPGAS